MSIWIIISWVMSIFAIILGFANAFAVKRYTDLFERMLANQTKMITDRTARMSNPRLPEYLDPLPPPDPFAGLKVSSTPPHIQYMCHLDGDTFTHTETDGEA